MSKKKIQKQRRTSLTPHYVSPTKDIFRAIVQVYYLQIGHFLRERNQVKNLFPVPFLCFDVRSYGNRTGQPAQVAESPHHHASQLDNSFPNLVLSRCLTFP